MGGLLPCGWLQRGCGVCGCNVWFTGCDVGGFDVGVDCCHVVVMRVCVVVMCLIAVYVWRWCVGL